MRDIANISAETRKVEITHPGTGDRIGIRWFVTHLDDERLMKVRRKITDRRLYLEARGKTFKAEEIEENRNELLIAASVNWEWYNPTGNEGDEGYDAEMMPSLNGEIPDFNRKNIKTIIADTKFSWLVDQVNEAIGDTKGFFTNSEAN